MDRLVKEYGVAVEWRPFELHPELPPEGVDREQMSAGKDPERARLSREYLEKTAREAGLDFKHRARLSNSRLALEAAEFSRAHDAGAFDRLHRGLFLAYFSQGRDIGDVAVLTELGASAGLDADLLGKALAERAFWDPVEQHLALVRRAGVHAVPTFIFDGRFMVQGAQPYPVFQRVMEEYVLPAQRGEGPGAAVGGP